MGNYTAKFLKQLLVIFAFSILFIAWQNYQNPEGAIFNYFFGCLLFLVGILINGFFAVLSAIEDKQKNEKGEDDEEDKKEILKG